MSKTECKNELFEREFDKAVVLAGGSQGDLGDCCKRSQQSVSLWLTEKSIPKKPAKLIVTLFPKLSLMRLMNI